MRKSVFISVCIISSALVVSFKSPTVLVDSDIVGEWQLGSKIVGSNKRSTYVFTSSKKFVYNTDGQDALIEVLNINGSYSIKKDTLYLQPLTITKRVGGKLAKNLYTTINDSWEITDGVIKTIKVSDSSKYPVIIKVISRRKVLEIDGSLYYKL